VRVQTLETRVRIEIENRPGARVFAAESGGSVISLRRGTRVRRTREVMLWQPRRSLEAGADAVDPETDEDPETR